MSNPGRCQGWFFRQTASREAKEFVYVESFNGPMRG
jgi:hypothetical protein